MYITATAANQPIISSTIKYSTAIVSGVFSFASGYYRYTWSGASNGTGILPITLDYSGVEFFVKNKSDDYNVLISGNCDNSINFSLTPQSTQIFWSDGQTWNSI